MFLKFIDKHFANSPELKMLFNRNKLKVIYGCTRSIEKIMVNHKKKWSYVITKNPVDVTAESKRNAL